MKERWGQKNGRMRGGRKRRRNEEEEERKRIIKL